MVYLIWFLFASRGFIYRDRGSFSSLRHSLWSLPVFCFEDYGHSSVCKLLMGCFSLYSCLATWWTYLSLWWPYSYLEYQLTAGEFRIALYASHPLGFLTINIDVCVWGGGARNLIHGLAHAKQVPYKAIFSVCYFFLNRHKIDVKGVLKVVFVSLDLRIWEDEAEESLVWEQSGLCRETVSHTHTHMHTYTQILTFTHSHRITHSHRHTHTHSCTHALSQSLSLSHTHTHSYTFTHTLLCTCTHIYT